MGKMSKITHLWCLNWCQSSKLQLAHCKGKGNTILTKQNIVATTQKEHQWQCEENNKGWANTYLKRKKNDKVRKNNVNGTTM